RGLGLGLGFGLGSWVLSGFPASTRSLQRASSSLLRYSYPLLISSRSLPQSQELAYTTSTFLLPTISTVSRPICRRNFSHGTVNLVISEGEPKFETRELDPPNKWKWLTKKRLKLKRKKEQEKRNSANRKNPRRLTIKGKKNKRKLANPEERIKNKLERAKIKEASLIEKLKRYEVAKAQGPEVRPHEITGEERFYLKKMGQKRLTSDGTSATVRRSDELAELSGGVPVNIVGDDTIIFYRGKGYVQPKAYEKSKYEQSLESVRHLIAVAEKELELYYRHVALYDDLSNRNPLSILDYSSGSCGHHLNKLYMSCSDTESESEDEELCKLDNNGSSSSSLKGRVV
ncbi:unnamed protein product, partial [Brassica oleracea var. botrytis]